MKKPTLNYYITHFGKLSKPKFVYIFVILVTVGIIIYKNESCNLSKPTCTLPSNYKIWYCV